MLRTHFTPGTLASLDCFLLVGLLGIYLKAALLAPQWGAIARFLGEDGPEAIPLAIRLGFFRADIWLNLLAVPIAGTLLVVAVSHRYRAAAAAAISAVLGLVYFVELQVQKEVGQYLSREFVRDLAGWSRSNPGMAFDYLTLTSLAKLAAFLATLGAVVRLAALASHSRDEARPSWSRTLLTAPAVMAVCAAVLLIALAAVWPVPPSRLARSSVGQAAALLLHQPDAGIVAGAEGTADAFRQLTATDAFDGASPYVGREADSDVLIFMMETGAAQALDLAMAGRDLPGTGPLLDRAFVASRHYTTHPYSSDALFSAFSGLYPQGRRRVLRRAPPGSIAGLMTSVSAGVPVRRVYLPSLYRIETDDRMYEALGAEVVYASDEHPSDPLRAVAERRADAFIETIAGSHGARDRRSRDRLRARLSADFQALEKAKRDIALAVRSRQRYMVMFFPQIGHGPWLSLGPEQTVRDRGRSLMLLQDAWLREMLDVVASLGRLDRTVVVVTADHGVRTRTEDPSLPVGEISDYMFRVPLLVHAPQTLASTVAIGAPTSHIDIAPTLLALLGATNPLAEMQGVPIWQRAPKNRIYLLAFAYGGADGFVQGGRYYMRQGLSGATYASRRFDFGDADQVSADDPVVEFVSDALTTLHATQQAVAARTVESLVE